MFSMASPSYSLKPTGKASLLGKRKPEDGLETEPFLRRHTEKSEEKGIEATVEFSETKSDEANLISVDGAPDRVEETGLGETPDFSEVFVVPKKTVFVDRIPRETELSDIIDFFKDVGQVVRIQLERNHKGGFVRRAFVEFASANQANKALETKKDECLHRRWIFLSVPRCLPLKYCIDHKVWYEEEEDYFPTEDDPDCVKEPVLFVANLSPQTTRISHIINFFKDVADVVGVRLIVDREGKHLGYGFVEFASAHQATRAWEYKNGEYLHDHKILLMKGFHETPDLAEAVATVRNKTLYISFPARQTKISDIINFFKDVGEVVHVRLIVDHRGRQSGFGYVEFASSNEAEKALEKKKGEYLHNREIYLHVVKADADPSETKYCIDHKVWYEDYPQGESFLIEDAVVEGLDETPDLVEDVIALRKKTVFVTDLFMINEDGLCDTTDIVNLFEGVGEIVGVRLIVDHWGENVGCCFVEFASSNEAKKAVEEMKGGPIYVNLAETAAPYPFRPKYNLADLAEELWYEDSLRREGLGLPKKSKHRKEEVNFCGKKITFSDKD